MASVAMGSIDLQCRRLEAVEPEDAALGPHTRRARGTRHTKGHPLRSRVPARIGGDATSDGLMARPLRFVPPGSLVEVTLRTLHGRLLLRPSSRANDLIVGVIGRAQRRYGIAIHGLVVLSNHAHLLLSADSPQQLAAFMDYVAGRRSRDREAAQLAREVLGQALQGDPRIP
jgi:hypothetical protein